MFKSILAAIAGAIIVFAWCVISWVYLPWHHWDMKSFAQGGEVITEALNKETVEVGLYVLPNVTQEVHTDKEAQQKWQEKAQAGPFVFMIVNPKGMMWDMNVALAAQFAIVFIAALVIAILMTVTGVGGVIRCALFASFAVTTGAFLVHANHMIWWGFPLVMTLVNIADAWIAWFLSGFVMGLFLRRA